MRQDWLFPLLDVFLSWRRTCRARRVPAPRTGVAAGAALACAGDAQGEKGRARGRIAVLDLMELVRALVPAGSAFLKDEHAMGMLRLGRMAVLK